LYIEAASISMSSSSPETYWLRVSFAGTRPRGVVGQLKAVLHQSVGAMLVFQIAEEGTDSDDVIVSVTGDLSFGTVGEIARLFMDRLVPLSAHTHLVAVTKKSVPPGASPSSPPLCR
jgi:hypothetical protein